MIIAVDFDGTLAVHKYPKIGEEVEGAIETCLELQKTHKLILYTMRSGQTLDDAVKWCQERGLVFWGVNENPEQKDWTDSPKVYAHIYIDDAAYGCPLNDVPNERPVVNWSKVSEEINRKK